MKFCPYVLLSFFGFRISVFHAVISFVIRLNETLGPFLKTINKILSIISIFHFRIVNKPAKQCHGVILNFVQIGPLEPVLS